MESLDKRWKAVRTWCTRRQISFIYAFFQGCDPKLEEYYNRIRYVIHSNSASVTDTDEPWLSSMELTIQAINNRKATKQALAA